MLQVQDIAGNPSNVIGLGLGTSAANTLTGPSASSANALYGFGGDDILTGGTAGDVLYGGDGNDRLVVTAGGDTLDAGANTTAGDTIDFANATSAVTFNLAGTATQNTGASFGSLTWFRLENIFGGSANDTFIGNSSANVLAGQGGNDTLTGGSGADTFVVTAGTDTITDLAVGGLDIVRIACGQLGFGDTRRHIFCYRGFFQRRLGDRRHGRLLGERGSRRGARADGRSPMRAAASPYLSSAAPMAIRSSAEAAPTR